MNLVKLINVADIIEDNGKTIQENNLEKTHDIPLGSLVEIKYSLWHGDGACEKIHTRLWVVRHDRDCDGTPLYSLSKHKKALFEDGSLKFSGKDGWWVKKYVILNLANDIRSGFAQEDLKVIEVTPDLIDGVNSLEWGKDE